MHQYRKIQEAQDVPRKMNLKSLTLRNIMIKLSKVKDKVRILNTARRKHLFMYKGRPLRLSADFSAKVL